MDNTLTAQELKSELIYNKDTGEFSWLYSKKGRKHTVGVITNKGYRRVTINGIGYQLHRLAWLYVYGVMPDKEVDHIDSNKLNNKIINLQLVTRQENQRNQKLFITNKSGQSGVCWHKTNKLWEARIGKKYLGSFKTLVEATLIRKQAEVSEGYNSQHGYK